MDVDQAMFAYAAAESSAAAVEAERRRLAESLESSVIEPLNLLLSQANVYEQALGANLTARTAVSVLTSLARQALQQARDLQANLYPSVLETLGLEPALETLAGQVTRAYGLQVTLTLERLPSRLPALLELALFRAAQDAVHRIVRHAHASQVIIRLERRDKQLRLCISDNGTTTIGKETLHAACQRIEQLGGSVETDASSYGGLELTVSFALEPPVQLSPREIEVLRLLSEGLSNKEIAQQLSLSPRTVNFHLDHIYSKLGVSSRTEAVIHALRHGWGRRSGSQPG